MKENLTKTRGKKRFSTYSAGLGSRNSAGFGMWEVMHEKKLQVESSKLQVTSFKLKGKK